jgi:hypothetical protein
LVGLSSFGAYSRSLLLIRMPWEPWTGSIEAAAQPVPPKERFVSIAFDVSQGTWQCRGQNWREARSSFLGAVTGTARKEMLTANLILDTPRGPITINQYWMNDSPRREGSAYLGKPDPKGRWQNISHWWRYDDPSIMTPVDRVAEMMDRAFRSPKLAARLREQAGGMLSPEALLPLAGIFLAMFGAEFVGGAALVLAIGRLLNINQWACDFYFYEPRCKQLNNLILNASRPEQLDEGAELIQDIFVQIITDIGTAVGIQSLVKVAGKLFRALLDATPEKMRNLLLQSRARATAYMSGKQYERTDLLKDPAGTPLETAAVDMYKKTSSENVEILVVREPDVARAAWVKSPVWTRGKPTWLKAKSSAGWNGLVCLKKAEIPGQLERTFVTNTHGDWKQNLRGVSAEIDAALDKLGDRPLAMYDMPKDGRAIGAAGKDIDYNYTGKGNVELDGHLLVDVGEGKLVVVDRLGVPYASDLDLATRQRPGMSEAGAHLKADPKRRHVEDDPVLEYDMNRTYHESGGNAAHSPNQHGGAGATVAYTRENLKNGKVPGKDFWSPKEGNGYKAERLVIFVPKWNGRKMISEMYVLESWGAFKDFAKANNLEFPF